MFARHHQGTASSPPWNQMKAAGRETMARGKSSVNQDSHSPNAKAPYYLTVDHIRF
jgi:hypothetical protein